MKGLIVVTASLTSLSDRSFYTTLACQSSTVHPQESANVDIERVQFGTSSVGTEVRGTHSADAIRCAADCLPWPARTVHYRIVYHQQNPTNKQKYHETTEPR